MNPEDLFVNRLKFHLSQLPTTPVVKTEPKPKPQPKLHRYVCLECEGCRGWGSYELQINYPECNKVLTIKTALPRGIVRYPFLDKISEHVVGKVNDESQIQIKCLRHNEILVIKPFLRIIILKLEFMNAFFRCLI